MVATALALHRAAPSCSPIRPSPGSPATSRPNSPGFRGCSGRRQDCACRNGATRSDAPPNRHETDIVTRTGETRWVEMSIARTDIDGQCTAVCSLVDITDRKLAEAAQKQAAAPRPDHRRRPRRPPWSSTPAIVTHWNRACEQILGMPAAAMVGTRRQWKPSTTATPYPRRPHRLGHRRRDHRAVRQQEPAPFDGHHRRL